MRFIYLANVRLPTEKAHGLQIMKTCEALADRGIEVVLCVPRRRNKLDADPHEFYGVKKNFKIRYFPVLDLMGAKPAKLAFAISQFTFGLSISWMRMNEDDVVYARDEYTLWPLSFYKKHLYFEAHDGRWNWMLKRALRHCEGIVAVTKGLVDFYVSKGISRDKQAVIPNGVDLARFEATVDRAATRAKFGLPLEKNIVLYTGHLYSWKGVDALAMASAFLPENSLVLFVGGTDHDVKSFREKFAGKTNIMIVGRKPFGDIPEYLAAADVLVIPNSGKSHVSELYTSPIKMFEYMATGHPIVASDMQSVREILNAKNAVLVPPDDMHALARGISSVLTNSTLASRIAAQARKDVEQYTWHKRAERIMQVFMRDEEIRDTKFYNDESTKYSLKRYPNRAFDYTHAFYLRRLDIVKRMLKDVLDFASHPSLLEVGCADGVVIRRVHDQFGTDFSSYRAIDISPNMIEAARTEHASAGIAFDVRNPAECFGDTQEGVILEVGVLNYTDLAHELSCASQTLKDGGYYIISIAGRGSLWDRRRRSDTGFKHFMTYKEYEAELENHFEILASSGVGLFIRGIWKVPVLARPIQVVAESFMNLFAKKLFHEKVYLLKKRRS